MKILFLTYISSQQYLFKNLGDLLKSKGKDVTYLANTPMDSTRFEWVKYCDWVNFDFSVIDSVDPDCIVILNGRSPIAAAAIAEIESKYSDKRILFSELAWFPQSENIYIDHSGVGGDSALSETDMTDSEESLSGLRTFDQDELKKVQKDFILVPLQLDHDTAITIDSPTFKTMSSLVAYVATKFPNKKIIVSKHPLDSNVYNFAKFPNVQQNNTGLTTLELAKQAEMIIGINSTVMIQSLVYCKPIFFLGKSVISESRWVGGDAVVFYNHDDLEYFVDHGHYPYKICAQSVNSVVNALLYHQINVKQPNERCLKYFN